MDEVIEVLKECQYCWADQVPNDGEKISDYDAISQTIKCLLDYQHSFDILKNL